MDKNKFLQKISPSYTFKGETIIAGSAVLGSDYETHTQIKLPLKSLTRHGLIAGATGTGKTKSLQVMAESLSAAGVPVMVMDIKGDLSGLGARASTNHIIEKRSKLIGLNWEGKASPIEFLSISKEPGARMKATVSEYGPILLSKILELNDNQSDIISLIFKFSDDRKLPILDLKDLKAVLSYILNEGKQEFLKEYGFVQTRSAGAILRSIVTLEQQDADMIFGEPSFDIFDLMGKTKAGEGIVSILRLTDMQTKPGLFSTFMLCLLAELFQKMPEKGDADKPELVLFIDEAHLIFKSASKSLLSEFEMTIKLIRSKGVGVFFITQSPTDIPASILGQLGTKIQHALRAFTAKDRKAIKLAAENYPYTEFYDVDSLITQLGIGEALISTLNEKGIPTELVHTLMCPPRSRMDILSQSEINLIVESSALPQKYNLDLDRESAYEILQERMEEKVNEETKQTDSKTKSTPARKPSRRTSTRKAPSAIEKIMKSPMTKTIARELTRGLLGVLGLKVPRSRR